MRKCSQLEIRCPFSADALFYPGVLSAPRSDMPGPVTSPLQWVVDTHREQVLSLKIQTLRTKSCEEQLQHLPD